MDYEKKYKEAMGIAEKIIRYYKEHNRSDENSIEDLEQIFPELKESEDEKIRKGILELIRQSSEVLDKQNQNSMIAWLEKQGEQKPFDYESTNIQQKDFAPKQEWSEEDERAIAIIKIALEHPYDMEGKWDRKFALDWLKSLKDRVQPQPKQEWSDEDEEMAEDLIKGCVSAVSPYQLTHTCQEIADWLKSLKNRMKGKED